ncbi:hypothetical protein PSEUDO8O_140087 [Pseudomonas sp. 8O]|nr:hypothetical protein PSEUDO8O_140087 [Pseudomonas sp. 8O]
MAQIVRFAHWDGLKAHLLANR